ncbi:hypothetical protein GE061_003437 [Apolygus lucorum]|uniref:THUMP domain-containing protein n=1 Tax=Apolygus lucorum TaxID=248454 RepID=A0A8S9X3J2_APOLU|nr:hypothetical protein GE061_003437 [Apolygus lucorum]
MGKGKKRKSYYSDFKDAKRWRGVLSVGMKGFLCTCNMRMKECIREAYNLLNDFSDKLDGPEKIEEPSDSIEDELEKELNDMRKKPKDKKFQVVETGADNTVFIKTTVDDPKKITYEIFSEIYTSKQNRSRFLLRMVPIDVTCKAYIEDIRKAADGLFDQPFKCDPLTFNVFYKARYNNSLLRDEVLSAMVTLVKDRNIAHKVDLTKPQKTVIVEVIKGVCCLSVVDDFYKYRKYNLAEAAKPESEPKNLEVEDAKPEISSETLVPSPVEAEDNSAKSDGVRDVGNTLTGFTGAPDSTKAESSDPLDNSSDVDCILTK